LEKHFARYSLDRAGVPEAVAEMLAELRLATLPGMNVELAQSCGSPKTSEWQFHLPAASGFGIDKIARVFRGHGDPEYADALEKLGSEPLEGFLQGFIDKIAVHGPACGVIDWKTNKLPAYDPSALRESARSSHYWLQTHLYLVALRRYFGPGSDIRGAWLIYLRGVRAATDAGILHVQPAVELLDALDELFLRPSR
jgi:exodeoxyribonuclease V beta subunit